ncbi:MAG: 50S ribosomal protein L23 [Bacteroidota bacterium]
MFLIKKPHHTEKALALNSKNQYVFMVACSANKPEIKKKIKAIYGITPLSVNTLMYKSKKVQRLTRKRTIKGERSAYKKAIVTLKRGDMIDIYETNMQIY